MTRIEAWWWDGCLACVRSQYRGRGEVEEVEEGRRERHKKTGGGEREKQEEKKNREKY